MSKCKECGHEARSTQALAAHVRWHCPARKERPVEPVDEYPTFVAPVEKPAAGSSATMPAAIGAPLAAAPDATAKTRPPETQPSEPNRPEPEPVPRPRRLGWSVGEPVRTQKPPAAPETPSYLQRMPPPPATGLAPAAPRRLEDELAGGASQASPPASPPAQAGPSAAASAAETAPNGESAPQPSSAPGAAPAQSAVAAAKLIELVLNKIFPESKLSADESKILRDALPDLLPKRGAVIMVLFALIVPRVVMKPAVLAKLSRVADRLGGDDKPAAVESPHAAAEPAAAPAPSATPESTPAPAPSATPDPAPRRSPPTEAEIARSWGEA